MGPSPTILSRQAQRCRALAPWLVLALVHAVTGCGRAGSEQQTSNSSSPAAPPSANAPGESAKSAAKAAEKPTPPALAAPPEGWTRVELSAVVPGLSGTIDLPPGVTAQAAEEQQLDAVGLEVEDRGLRLGPPVGGASLRALADIPPRFESAEVMARFHGNFEHVSTHEYGPDHWAVVQRWRPGECMLHGWSAAAGLTCEVFKAPCDEMAQWVEVCGTLRPGPTPNEAPTTPSSAFPELELAAAEVAVRVARAVARNDQAMLLGALGPAGVKIGNKKHTAESLEAALAGSSVLKVVAPIYGDGDGGDGGDDIEGVFSWNSGPSKPGEVKVWFTSGYGEQAYFILKQAGGDWHLVEFGVYDLGEP